MSTSRHFALGNRRGQLDREGETIGRVVVAYSDLKIGASKFASINLAASTLAKTPMSATVPWLAADAVVSPDGTKLYCCGYR
jgi:hypothetical protein